MKGAVVPRPRSALPTETPGLHRALLAAHTHGTLRTLRISAPEHSGSSSGGPSAPSSASSSSSSSSTSSSSSGAASEASRATSSAATSPADEVKKMAPEARKATIRRLLSLAWEERGPLSVAVGTVGITSSISLVFPMAIGRILDVALSSDPTLTPDVVGMGLLGLFTVQAALIVLRTSLLSISGERIAARIRSRLFESLLSQEAAFFDARRTGELINRLSSDTVVAQKSITGNLTNALRSSFMAVGGAGALVYLSPQLALLSLALIPVVGIAARHFGRYIKNLQEEVQTRLGKTMEVAEELVSNIRTVRQFAAEGREANRFEAAVQRAYEESRKVGLAEAGFDGLVHFAANLSLIAVLWYGGTLVQSGAMTAGDLTAFLMYSLYTGFNFSQLSTVYTDAMRGVGASSRIFDIMDRTPALPLHGGLQPTPIAGRIEFQNVQFAYPQRADVPVLRDFSVTVEPGQVLALVGASGTGKSTVGALLTRLYDPAQGSIRVDGVDLKEWDASYLRGVAVGTVAQEPVLFAGTVRDNIRYARPDATEDEVRRAATLANAHAFIEAFPEGYDTLVGERGIQLSGGQRQRIAIARVLLKSPPVVLLDEATSALDAESEAAVQEALQHMMQGRTVISIAHRLSTMRHADVVAVLQHGRVAEFGRFDDLIRREQGLLRQLVARQLVPHNASKADIEETKSEEGEVIIDDEGGEEGGEREGKGEGEGKKGMRGEMRVGSGEGER